MTIGESIYSSVTKTTYVVCQVLKNSGQAELAYAQTKHTHQVFFVKKLISVRYIPKGVMHERSVDFENERRRIYRTINSNTLPSATCSYIHDFFHEKSFYYIVTERVDGVPLNPRCLYKALSFEERLNLFLRIAYSFLPFERGGIIHGDVKPDNILLKRTNDWFTIRLIDFETSFFYATPPAQGFVVGTEPYYSPELAQYNDEKNETGKNSLSTKSDVFSLGIILFELLTGKYPTFKDKRSYCYEAVSKGEKISMPTEWSKELKALFYSMLSHNPSSRPSVIDIVERLKTLPDKDSAIPEICQPETFIYHISENKATVSLFSYNYNSQIKYSVDHGESHIYEEPFIIDDDDVEIEIYIESKVGIKTERKKFNKIVSVSSKRNTKVPRPTISIEKGVVSISCSIENANIFYTLNGTSPTKYSQKYDGSFSVGEKVMIKAFARCLGMLPSDVASINSSSKIKMS